MAKPRSYRVNIPRLRALREARGWTMSDLARRMRMEVSTTARWENGTNRIRVAYLETLADTLDVDPDELILPDLSPEVEKG